MNNKIISLWSKFIRYLEAYCKEENRGVLAILRRSLGIIPESDVRVFPIVYPGIKIAELNQFQEKTAFMIAALYAFYHSGSREIITNKELYWNFGDSFRLLVTNKNEIKSIEHRFMALLNSHEDDLIQHLKKNMSLLKSKKVFVNWAELAEAIQYWAHPDKFIQIKWAQSFYSSKKIINPIKK